MNSVVTFCIRCIVPALVAVCCAGCTIAIWYDAGYVEPVEYNEVPVRFFQCGTRLLLLTEDREGDSLKLMGRWCDTSGVQSDRVNLAGCIPDGDYEQGKEFYTILPSSDSSHFFVWNKPYPIVRSGEQGKVFDNSIWVFNTRLDMLQHQTFSSSNPVMLKAVQVDNNGILYIVQESPDHSLFLHRYSGSGSLTISVPLPDLDTVQARCGTAFLLPANTNEGYLFSIIQAGESDNMRELDVWRCNWQTGTITTLARYETGSDIAQKIVNKPEMDNFQLQNVYSTPQGFVVWAEQEAGTTGLFAFDKQGRVLWKKGLADKGARSMFNRYNRHHSYGATVNDTLCLLKIAYDAEFENKSMYGRILLSLHPVALSTGESGTSVPLLSVRGTARIVNGEFWCTDRRNLLLPYYEPDRGATSLLHMRL